MAKKARNDVTYVSNLECLKIQKKFSVTNRNIPGSNPASNLLALKTPGCSGTVAEVKMHQQTCLIPVSYPQLKIRAEIFQVDKVWTLIPFISQSQSIGTLILGMGFVFLLFWLFLVGSTPSVELCAGPECSTLRSRPELRSRVRHSTNWATQVPHGCAFSEKEPFTHCWHVLREEKVGEKNEPSYTGHSENWGKGREKSRMSLTKVQKARKGIPKKEAKTKYRQIL